MAAPRKPVDDGLDEYIVGDTTIWTDRPYHPGDTIPLTPEAAEKLGDLVKPKGKTNAD